ncbi:hypothetical protein LPB86_18970 [Pedobacter sp. MC2016-14]|uniref:hypothetical protein n=1 Tax=Pedobacter sp. MC2016-14 TaxID=2897327 RepID=UPI001E4BF2D2|nr:hypothetical protein [Pedobacter sp. MC2016-14]MCD0490327.1 hypothetical protein [Pedobacter sp. MC2016-14]
MNRILTITAAFMLVFTLVGHAQDPAKKKKPGFGFNSGTMTELNFTQEQRDKIKAIQVESSQKVKKIQEDGKVAAAAFDKSVDSLLTAPQRVKLAELKTAQGKAFNLNKKACEDLGVSPEVEPKLLALAKENHVFRWKGSQAWAKINKEVIEAQLAVLTEEQKKKVDEMKKAIDDYNKSI